MGIQGLLPFLKSIQRPTHLKDWSGRTLAVDGYVWLHRAAYSCAQEICLGTPTTKHVDYFLQKINLLRHHGVEAYVVFDGDRLPSKKLTEKERESRRESSLGRAQELLAQGQRDKAREEFIKAVDITPQLAHDVIVALRSVSVKYVVAPYEADAQLRYLEIQGEVDGILTEDSDLLVYGAKNVFFKLDPSGFCVHICRDDFGKVDGARMSLWTDREFRHMAILSGCDYLASIPGLGIKKAYDLIRRFKTADRAIKATRLDGRLTVPRKYEKLFEQAEATFLYQFVYDSKSRSLVPLHPLPDDPPPDPESLLGCGERWNELIAIGVAEGNLCPLTKQAFGSRPPVIKPCQSSDHQRTSSKRTPQNPTSRLASKQPTLTHFVIKKSNTNSQISKQYLASSSTQPPVRGTIKPTTSHNRADCPSKFFCGVMSIPSSPEKDLEEVTDGLTQKLKESPPDAASFSQENWDGLTEISTDDGQHKQELELERLMGDDLPSSQMQNMQNVKPLDLSLPSVLDSPLSTPETVHQSSYLGVPSSPPAEANCPVVEEEPKLSSDDIITSESDCAPQIYSHPRVTLITPSTSTITAALKRRATEPVTHIERAALDSDPIIESDDHPSPLNRRRLTKGDSIGKQPSRKAREGVQTPGSKKLDFEDTPMMSPSLARVASGLRQRFTYQANSRKTVADQNMPQSEPRPLRTLSQNMQPPKLDFNPVERPIIQDKHQVAERRASRLSAFLFKGTVS